MAAKEIKDEEAMMSLKDSDVKVVPRGNREPSYFGTKTKLSIVCLTLVLIGVGAALMLGYPKITGRSSGIVVPTNFEEEEESNYRSEQYFNSQEALHPKDNHPDSLEGHQIILNKVSDLRSSFNSRFPRDHSGGYNSNYGQGLEEIPEAFLRTLAYASQNSEEGKAQDVFVNLDTNRDSQADPWELHDWMILVQRTVQSSVHMTQWQQFIKDENDTISWSSYVHQINPMGTSNPKITHRITRGHRRWQNADQNDDDHLDIEEFKIFLFPYTLDRVALNIIIPEAMDNLDINFDGAVSLEEFLQIHDQDQRAKMSEYFENTLDTNHDGYLNSYEITPWVNPEGFVAIKSEVIHLMEALDANKDKVISLNEIQRSPRLFLSSQITSFGEIYRLPQN